MRRLILISLVVAFAAVACGNDDTSPRGDTTTSAGAQRAVTIDLLAHASFVVPQAALDEFTATTGISVNVLLGEDAGTVTNQVILDREHPQADVVFGIDNTYLGKALAADVFAVAEHDVSALAPDLVADVDTARVVPVDYGDVCLNYDIAWFAAEGLEPPDALSDLVDPAYEGLTVVEDPTTSSPGLAFLLATTRATGDWEAYWQRLRDNDVLVASGWEEAYTVEFSGGGGGGDRPIVVSYASSPPADVVYSDPPREAPAIGVVDDGCFRQVEYAGILAGTDAPDAAARVIEFLLSEPFQAEVPLGMFVFPARVGTPLPDVFEQFALRATTPVTIDAATIDDERADLLDRWTELVLS